MHFYYFSSIGAVLAKKNSHTIYFYEPLASA